LLALTFDVEREYGSFRLETHASNVKSFLSRIEGIEQNATIFVEGSLVKEHSEALHSLEKKGIEIGLHGWQHELWGSKQWYLNDKPLQPDQKATLLKAAFEDFQLSSLHRPTAFRAPNLVADESTLKLLESNGFQVDSSLPSHRGVAPIPQFPNGPSGIIRIPVSVEPTPLLDSKSFIPYYRFRVCNLKTAKQMRGEKLLDCVTRIAMCQEAFGFLPHLVMLSHSWEFFPPLVENRDYAYCSATNFELLDSVVNSLSESFAVKRVSMSDLGELIKQKQHKGAQNQ
jgi:hypothetical protein